MTRSRNDLVGMFSPTEPNIVLKNGGLPQQKSEPFLMPRHREVPAPLFQRAAHQISPPINEGVLEFLAEVGEPPSIADKE